MSQLEPFIYTPLPPGHIRLLHILPRQNLPGYLTCKLEVFSLDRKPQYEALSYAWGTRDTSEYIICGGAKLSLTPHWLDGLRNISKVISVPWLWIDAICINQSDQIEKASQVMQMWQIYSAASRVVIWMGPSDLTYEGMSTIRAACNGFKDKDLTYGWSEEQGDQFLFPLRGWYEEVAKLFTSDWFERLWVVQESLLAHRAVALYGTQLLDLSSVMQLGDLFYASDAAIQISLNPGRLAACTFFNNFKTFTKRMLEADQVIALMDVVRTKQTSERLDRVYAVLGLLEEQVREQIHIDYREISRERYWKAYVNFCRLVLRTYGESYLILLSVADRSPMMPSWCLNLDREGAVHGLGKARGGAGIDAVNERCREVVFNDSGLTLLLKAHQADVIEMALVYPDTLDTTRTIVYDDLFSEKHLAFASSCNDLALEIIRSENKTAQTCLAKVLVGGRKIVGSSSIDYPPQEAEEDLQKCLEIWNNSQLETIRKMELLGHGRYWQYLSSSTQVCIGRSISSTSKGRLVLGPKDAQEGDVILVIKGFQWPYALRPTSGEGGQDADTYRILGPCYVDDIMNGEVLNSEDFKTSGWSEIFGDINSSTTSANCHCGTLSCKEP